MDFYSNKNAHSAKAVLLLIPGTLNGADIWNQVTRLVIEKYGDSLHVVIANVLTQSSIQQMAEDAWAGLAALPADLPLYVAGFSMGGYVAQEMLVQPRRPLKGAWLIATSAEPETPEGTAGREKAIASLERDFEKAIRFTAGWGMHESQPDRLEALLQSMRSVGAETAVRQMRANKDRRDLRGALAQVDIPVQVLCGKNDRVTPYPLSEKLADLLPRASLHLLDDTGHIMPLERPEAIAESFYQHLFY